MGKSWATQKVLRYGLDLAAGIDEHWIDLSRNLSEYNRRAYSQGRVYIIKRMWFQMTAGAPVNVQFSAAPQTWTTHRAWQLVKNRYDRMVKEALAGTGIELPKWHEFKVRLEDDARTDPDVLVLTDSDDNPIPTGEWDYSTFTGPSSLPETGDSFVAHLCGRHNGNAHNRVSVGAIHTLEEVMSREANLTGEPEQAATLPDNWMLEVGHVDDYVDEIVSDLVTEGDKPPYGRINVPGGELLASAIFAISNFDVNTTNVQVLEGPFEIPCGLLKIETNTLAPVDSGANLGIELMPGPYLGVKAKPMGTRSWR